MKKRVMGAGLLLCAALASGAKPNVVIFLVDDMGLMDTSVPMLADENGAPKRYPLNDWYRTPNMERLAEQGTRLSTFYAYNTCSPTRISILGGQHPLRHGATAWLPNGAGEFQPHRWDKRGLKPGDVTLPSLLGAAGYRTFHVGKAHYGSLPQEIGFDVNIGGAEFGHPGSYYGKDGFGAFIPKVKNHAVPHLEKYHGQDIFLTEALTLEAKDLLTQAVADEKPFFLYMTHYAVHAPFQKDPRFAANYKGKKNPALAFATLIEGMDKSLGDLMDHLDALGVAEDTLILFMGDNGSDGPLGTWGEFGAVATSAPLRGMKGTAYEGGTRVPFIAAWAKPNPENRWQKKLPICAGKIQQQMGTVMDVFPTVLSVTGLNNPAEHALDGVDLSTQLCGQRNPSRYESFMVHFPHDNKGDYFTTYRKGDWKLIYRYLPVTPDQPAYELYNLETDQAEQNNLAQSHPEQLNSMAQAMLRELDKQKVCYPVDTHGNELQIRRP